MKNKDKLIQCFIEALNIEKGLITESLKYQSIPQWDSIAHMSLVAKIENYFDIMLDTEEILDMSSVTQIKLILGKHKINFDD